MMMMMIGGVYVSAASHAASPAVAAGCSEHRVVAMAISRATCVVHAQWCQVRSDHMHPR